MTDAGSPLMWIVFASLVVVMLALDLGVFNRRAHVVSTREAAIWSAVWVALSLGFNGLVAWRFGSEAAQAFFAGYVIEKALSVDNLFVFYMVFSAFRVEDRYQHRVLFWGIIGALAMRTAMVAGGTWVLGRFHAVIYLFGGILVFTGAKMLVRPEKQPHPDKSRVFQLLRRVLPTASGDHGGHLFLRQDGALKVTTLFLVLVLIELSDVVFAVDSILAIFAVTIDPFIVLTSNIFAVMGLRSLYFVLAGLARRFIYLQPGLALVLLFVGVKMAVSGVYHIPIWASLLVVLLLLGGSIVASVIRTRTRPDARAPSSVAEARR